MQVIPAVAAVGDGLLGRLSSLAPCGTFGRMSPANMSARYGRVGALAIARMRSRQNAREDGDVTIEARPVEPRDVTISVDAPTFRVYFWRSPPSLACREFEVTGADVDEIIEWAEDHKAAGETYELGVLTPVAEMQEGDVVLTRIKGTDPTRSEGGGGTPATARG